MKGKGSETRKRSPGAELSFDRVLADHKDMVFSLCVRVLGNVDDAEDCAQDVFVRIFQKLDSFKGDSKISTWIYRVA